MGIKADLLVALSKAETEAERAAIQAQIDRLIKARGDAAAGIFTTPFVLPEDYTVVAGDSAFSIAEDLYGDQRAAFDLMAANPDIFVYDPRTGTYTTTIHPGQTLNVPQGAVGGANVPSTVGFTEASGDTVFFGTTPGSERIVPAAGVTPTVADEATAFPTSQEVAAAAAQQLGPGGDFTPDQLAPPTPGEQKTTEEQLGPGGDFTPDQLAPPTPGQLGPGGDFTPDQLAPPGGFPPAPVGFAEQIRAEAGLPLPQPLPLTTEDIAQELVAGATKTDSFAKTPETGTLTTAQELHDAITGDGDFPTMSIDDATAIGISPQLAAQLGYVVVGDEYIPTGATGTPGTTGFTPGAYFTPTFGFDPTGSTRYQRGRRGGSGGRGRRSTGEGGYARWNIGFS